MADPVMVREYPEKQRAAICSSQLKKSGGDTVSDTDFEFYLPLVKSYEIDETDYIEGVASLTLPDNQKDTMSKEAIKSMKEQAIGLYVYDPPHKYTSDNIVGEIVDVRSTDDNQFKPVIELSKATNAANRVRALLREGKKLGLSIGGKARDYSLNDAGRTIHKVLLREISVTPMPVLSETLGTVQFTTKSCEFPDICGQIFKSIEFQKEEKIMSEDKKEEKVQPTMEEILADMQKNQAQMAETITEMKGQMEAWTPPAATEGDTPPVDGETLVDVKSGKEVDLDLLKAEIRKEIEAEVVKGINDLRKDRSVVRKSKDPEEIDPIKDNPGDDPEDIKKSEEKPEGTALERMARKIHAHDSGRNPISQLFNQMM